MIYDEKDQMEKDRNLWKFRLRVKSHVIPAQHHEECDLPTHDKARKCIAVAEMIISLHKNNFTPFNLGLALQLYHGYGSKHLIETLYAFGSDVVSSVMESGRS
jgi:hypothetical protein